MDGTTFSPGMEANSGDADNERQIRDVVANPKINALNVLNMIAYVFNIVVTFGIGVLSWAGNGSNGELSRKYQTIITPASQAFSIWQVIFILQAIFAVAQLLPRFRGLPMVRCGVGYWYIVTCITQAGWTFAFAFEIIPLSLALILSIWGSLVVILYKQYYTKSDGTLLEFWLLRFPFALHCGWLTAASALNTNVQVVDSSPGAGVELAVGIVSLAVLHAISVFLLTVPQRPNFTIPCVLTWANGWIYYELTNPPESIKERFSEDSILGVRYAAISVSFIILAQVVIRVGVEVTQKFRKEQVTEDDNAVDEENAALREYVSK